MNRALKFAVITALATFMSLAAISQANAISLTQLPLISATISTLSLGPTPIPGDLFPVPSAPPVVLPPIELPTVAPIVPSLHTIEKTSSGLVAFDPLTNETKNKAQLLANSTYWTYNGSAEFYQSPYDLYKDSEGLHLGVQSPALGEWRGIYGVTPVTDASLFHSVITTDRRTNPPTIPSTFYSNGLYVQTAAITDVNYVTCISDTSSFGTVWAIFSATGNEFGATEFNRLWVDNSTDQSLTRDCTIITNGDNYLKVYLDGVNVYTNSTINMQMPAPYMYFLEPQNPGMQMYYGIYKDFYATKDEVIKVTDVPSFASKVDVVDLSGNVLSSASVVNGTALADVGKYHFPLTANIKAYDSSNKIIATTSSPVDIYGGDVYSAN